MWLDIASVVLTIAIGFASVMLVYMTDDRYPVHWVLVIVLSVSVITSLVLTGMKLAGAK
jgi:membrane protein YdbS with pleckstrin-like domain